MPPAVHSHATIGNARCVAAFVVTLAALGLTAAAAAPADESAPSQGTWTPIAQGLVQDASSKLYWSASDNGSDIDWPSAQQYCAAKGRTWRLPRLEELRALHESAAAGNACEPGACRAPAPFALSGDWFWSAMPVGKDAYDGVELAWGMRLSTGAETQSVKEAAYGARALCVSPAAPQSRLGEKPETKSSQPRTAGARALTIDPSHTAVVFSWNHRGLSHPVARLERIAGRIELDPSNLAHSSVSVVMAISGLRTGDDFLDRRLSGPEFFDITNYPNIKFQSTKVEVRGPDSLRIEGVLSVHGVSKPVAFDARLNKIIEEDAQVAAAGFDAELTLHRSDFGVGKYVPMVGDELIVHITVEAGAG
jgi:polyisoprenoid-binding protein YceI